MAKQQQMNKLINYGYWQIHEHRAHLKPPDATCAPTLGLIDNAGFLVDRTAAEAQHWKQFSSPVSSDAPPRIPPSACVDNSVGNVYVRHKAETDSFGEHFSPSALSDRCWPTSSVQVAVARW